MTLAATGEAITSTSFTYKAPAGGAYTNTITVGSTGLTSATITAK